MSTPDEPLSESAPLCRALAHEHCSAACLDYHATWQYFRLIGLISTIATDNDFLINAIRKLAVSGEYPRVLISATADYGMLARIIHAYRQAGQIPLVTVLDLCETPLAINRWYAERHGLAIRTVRENILDFRPDEKFDLICTHSFLGRLPPDVRKGALARWHDLLRPGGKVITSVRVHHCAGPVPIGYRPEEIQAFHDKALSLAQSMRNDLDIPPETLAHAAKQYALNKRTRQFGTLEEIRGYFADADFMLDELTPIGHSRHDDRPSHPQVGWKTERVNIIANRP